MKTQTSKQTAAKKPQTPLAGQNTETTVPSKSARQARSSFDERHARITARGCGLEDWLDAERGILSREFSA